MSFEFVFDPGTKAGTAQSRLSIYVTVRATAEETASSLGLLLERGPLARFYRLEPISEPVIPRDRMRAFRNIVRREELIRPLHSPEFNDRSPEAYYTIRSFEANKTNDYLALDGVFDKLCESAIVEICVSPADITADRLEHTRCLAVMDAAVRSCDREEEGRDVDYLGSRHLNLGSREELRPLRRGDPLADDVLRHQRRFHETFSEAHLAFQIRVLAETEATASLLGGLVAESAFEKGAYRLLDGADDGRILRGQPPGDSQAIDARMPGSGSGIWAGLARLAHVAPVNELVGAFRLPIASYGSPCCIRKNTDPPCEVDGDMIVLGYDMDPPREGDQAFSGVPRGIPCHQLCKQTFGTGMPGCGKTTLGQNLLTQFTDRGISTMVFESSKTEYRLLKQLKHVNDAALRRTATELRIYTPGNEAISPLRFNPLWIRHGISVDEHIGNLMHCFHAAMPMSGPLPALFCEALERVYEQFPDPSSPPVMADLLRAAEHVLAEKGYSAETNSDLRGALDVRLGMLTQGSIGRIFQCPQNVPSVDELFMHPTVVELDALPKEQASLMTLFLLTAAREFLKTAPPIDGPVRWAVLLEEAHLLVPRCAAASPSEDHANPSAYASEYVVKMLAETRALKCAVVVLDQLPSALAPEVIKNTSNKLGFRLVGSDDREEFGRSALFGQLEDEEIARLPVGQAYFYREGFHGPRRIRTVNPFEGLGPISPLDHGSIVPYLQDEPWYAQAASERTAAQLNLLNRQVRCFETKRLGIIGEVTELAKDYPQMLRRPTAAGRVAGLRGLVSSARACRRRLAGTLDAFVRRNYRPLIGAEADHATSDSSTLRAELARRFTVEIMPRTQACLAKLDQMISRYATQLKIEEGR